MPPAASAMPPRSVSSTTVVGAAPSATRTPISGSRWATEYASTPYNPIEAMANASTANTLPVVRNPRHFSGSPRLRQVVVFEDEAGHAGERPVAIAPRREIALRYLDPRRAAHRAQVLPKEHEPIRLRNGSGRSSTALMTLKIAVLAPMPSASIVTATSENRGDDRSARSA